MGASQSSAKEPANKAGDSETKAATKLQALQRGNSVRKIENKKKKGKPQNGGKAKKADENLKPWQKDTVHWDMREKALDDYYSEKTRRAREKVEESTAPPARAAAPAAPPKKKKKTRGFFGMMSKRTPEAAPEPAGTYQEPTATAPATPPSKVPVPVEQNVPKEPATIAEESAAESTAPPPRKSRPPNAGMQSDIVAMVLDQGRRYDEFEAVITFGELVTHWQDAKPAKKAVEEWHDELREELHRMRDESKVAYEYANSMGAARTHFLMNERLSFLAKHETERFSRQSLEDIAAANAEKRREEEAKMRLCVGEDDFVVIAVPIFDEEEMSTLATTSNHKWRDRGGAVMPRHGDMAVPVDIDEDDILYVIIEATPPKMHKVSGTVKLIRGYMDCTFHADILEVAAPPLAVAGYASIRCLGGGYMKNDAEAKTLLIYGDGAGFGRADHELAAKLCRDNLDPGYQVTTDLNQEMTAVLTTAVSV